MAGCARPVRVRAAASRNSDQCRGTYRRKPIAASSEVTCRQWSGLFVAEERGNHDSKACPKPVTDRSSRWRRTPRGPVFVDVPSASPSENSRG
jgi:hypothetical protein